MRQNIDSLAFSCRCFVVTNRSICRGFCT